MNYFDYQPKVPMGRVWSLFSQLSDQSEEEILGKGQFNYGYAHSVEIVKAAITGTLSTSDDALEGFNLKAYEAKCRKNDEIDFKQSVDKCLFIVDNNLNDSDEGRVGYGDISANKIVNPEDAFALIDSMGTFESNIDLLLNIRTEYIETKGIDLVSIIVSSLKGIPEAVDSLATLLKENCKLKDLVVGLCEDSDSGELLSRLALVM